MMKDKKGEEKGRHRVPNNTPSVHYYLHFDDTVVISRCVHMTSMLHLPSDESY